MTVSWVGQPRRRREDRRLVLGQGAYVDDLPFPEALQLAFVRSPLPHCEVGDVDRESVRNLAGVVDVLTAADLPPSVKALPLRAVALPDGFTLADVPMPILASGRARFVGEAMAAVIAESREAAADAAELLMPQLDQLPSSGTIRGSLEGGPSLHQAAPDNILFSYAHSGGEVDVQFARADRVVRGHFNIPRLQASPMETRGCVAAYDQASGKLTLWCSSQDPHRPRLQLAHVLGLRLDDIRVVVPTVGGAFGSKGGLAPEYAVAAVAAMRLGRPVKWVETRSESFLAAYQGRGMEGDCELAVAGDGRLLGLRASLRFDAGAYLLGHTAVVAVTASSLLTGAYDIPAAHVELVGVATNKVPTGPYRGAGRPEATFLIERMVDLAARELDMDPVQMRRLNLVRSDSFPYLAATGSEYDSGDYPGLLERALELSDRFAPDSKARDGTTAAGVGIAVAVESSGNSNWEAARARLEPDGHVLILPGSSDHGQGHWTTFSQIAADTLELSPEDVEVRSGDSAEVPLGVGTFASRSVTVGGSAVVAAVQELQARCLTWGAHLLDVPEEKLQWSAGRVLDRATGRSLSLADLAKAAVAGGPGFELPELSGDGRFELQKLAFGSSAAVAHVTVDLATGMVTLERLVVVDDAGPIVNPLLAEGQVVGSSIQGVAATLLEEVLHDAEGVPLTEGFMSYEIPTMPDMQFDLVTEFRPTPSPLSPLGTKGVAETGCIVVPAAIANAVADALASLGIEPGDPPYSPEAIWKRLSGMTS